MRFFFLFLTLLITQASYAEGTSSHPLLGRILGKRQGISRGETTETQGLYTHGVGTSATVQLKGRSFILYTPPHLPPKGEIPLLVVLHGGMGNGQQIKDYIGLEPFADKNGFLIAYPNGTAVTRILSAKQAGWNAGGCCGQPAAQKVDDVGFLTSLVHTLIATQGVDPQQVYGSGHSNGAMMTYRMLCESDVYQGAALYSGVLEIGTTNCPKAQGKPILAIHGEEDTNVPFQGGHTPNGINRRTNYHSQPYTQKVFEDAGAKYTYLLLPEATHHPETINAALLKTEGVSLPEKITTFLGLNHK